MDLFAIDDSKVRKPSREKMRPLVSVGGLHVAGEQVRGLELALDSLCQEFGFPLGEEFKWSPGRRSWQYQHLHEERREQFFLRALALAKDAGAQGIVAITDTVTDPLADANTHEESVTLMFLERADAALRAGRHAIVVFDRPSGDRKSETKFLSETLTALRTGTSYSKLDRLALAVATDSHLSRLVQLADVVTSSTTSFVGGEDRFSPKIFCEGVRPLLRSDYGCIGGRGLKLHPDYRYRNLYHWLLDDDYYIQAQTIQQELPARGHGYADSADTW